jgi:hypothetical protein
MNSRQRKTLEAVFEAPTRKTLEWASIESLLKAVGCEVIEGNGSRVRFVKGQHAAAFHRPHPTKEAKAYQVEQARDFLTLLGATP